MTNLADAVADALDSFRIELPSWGFANTGTRFGKFLQPAAAATIEEKFSDAAQVHALTGACPTLALHVLWDFPSVLDSVATVAALADRHGVRPGSINPNVFGPPPYTPAGIPAVIAPGQLPFSGIATAAGSDRCTSSALFF